jgi:predicted enzyme related to lactoylglutathione lyase
MSHLIGSVGWVDLTVPDAPRLRDFYQAVVGWRASDLDMGGYADYVMQQPADGKG